ncbi:ankyrin repeat-containing domain protein [Tirmania nivea]|nr:ankyrin repeat-containing domain protein [Tirmania nivea]
MSRTEATSILHPDPAGLVDLPHFQPTRYNFLSLPNELLLEIAEYTFNSITYGDPPASAATDSTALRDATAFLLVNHRLNQLLTPYLLRVAMSKVSWGPPHWHRSILHWAAAHGSLSLLRKVLLYGGSKMINQVDSRGISPLMTAVLHNDAAITELLLEEGADVELGPTSSAAQARIFTPLHCAVAFGYHDILGLLLGAGADTESTAFAHCTPLHIASMIGDVKDASISKEALVQAGANRNAQSLLGYWYTPIQIEEELSKAKAIKTYKEREEGITQEGIDNWLDNFIFSPLGLPLYFLRSQLSQFKEVQHEWCPHCVTTSYERQRARKIGFPVQDYGMACQ